MSKKIPAILIWLRLAIGLILIGVSIVRIHHYEVVALILISIGLLSDIFDGIIARHLNVSTERLRRLDSIVDQAFWCLIIAATVIQHPGFFYSHAIGIALLIAVEAATYLVSFARFGKEVATHAISSKIWTLLLFATLFQLIATGNSVLLFNVCLYVGIATRLEVIAILMLLRRWTNDVPSVYHAVLLRQGKTIRRHKMFNG
jgi:CDP-diacylglycerol--glycerol-3-phosphate 3-phosphatidyltransferase